MTANRMLFALGVPAAIIMLVGCKQQPIGDDSVRTATTDSMYCCIDWDAEHATGHIWFRQTGPRITDYDVDWAGNDVIVRYYQSGVYGPDPQRVGVCVFQIPSFDPSGGVPACTLVYYQAGHSGNADLLVNAPDLDTFWPGHPDTMYHRIVSNTDTVATDSTHANGGWYRVPLSAWACAAIGNCGAAGGGVFYTGWVSTSDGDSTEVCGNADGFPPRIKVVYEY